jgi:hypothetical protein
MSEKQNEVKKVSVLEQLKKLDEQRQKLLDGAKQEALAKAEAAVVELNAIGFSYRLVEGSGAGKKGKGTRNTDPSKKHCNVCDMAGHDGRAHRSQGKNKKKFTAAELKELDLG